MNSMVMLLLFIAIFWFLMIRPQQQQAKKRAEMLTALKSGDKIVTIGGICGVVSKVTDDKVWIQVADGIVIEMLRNAISSVETEEDLEDPFADEDEDEDDDLYYDEDEDEIIDVDVDEEKDN